MKTLLKTAIPLLALLLSAAAPMASGKAADRSLAILITGGPVGRFVDTPHSLTPEGYTDFSANLKLYQDGTAAGEFTCAIPNFVVLSVIPTGWSVKPDGSIRVTGNEYGYDAVGGAGYSDCAAILEFHAGGVGVGRFDFQDCVFPEGLYDTELVRVGSINITYF